MVVKEEEEGISIEKNIKNSAAPLGHRSSSTF